MRSGLAAAPTPVSRAISSLSTSAGLVALPTMAVVLAYPGNWLESEESTADYSKVLHGEQYLTVHRPIPAAGTVIGRSRVKDLLDKGKEKGAVLFVERQILDKASGEPIATMTLGGDAARRRRLRWQARAAAAAARASRAAGALSLDIKVAPNAALIYRLSGDRNPLHADPAAAAKGGFKMPILHGLCTYGVAGRAIIKACCEEDPPRLKSLQGALLLAGFSGRDDPHRDVAGRLQSSLSALGSWSAT